MPNKSHPMEEWLKKYPPGKGDTREEPDRGSAEKNPRKSSPRRDRKESLDLHGMTREEALLSLREFLRNSAARGRRKVLIIHGRGTRSAHGAVLPDLVRRELEGHPLVWDLGPAEPENGGAGALWVFLRQRSR